jgi:hypothetical protein
MCQELGLRNKKEFKQAILHPATSASGLRNIMMNGTCSGSRFRTVYSVVDNLSIELYCAMLIVCLG